MGRAAPCKGPSGGPHHSLQPLVRMAFARPPPALGADVMARGPQLQGRSAVEAQARGPAWRPLSGQLGSVGRAAGHGASATFRDLGRVTACTSARTALRRFLAREGSRGRQHPCRSRALRAVSQTPRGVAPGPPRGPGPLRALTCSTVLAAVWWAPGRDLGAHPNVLEVVAGLRPELAQDGPMRPWAGAPHGGPSPAPLPCASLSPLWPLHVFPVDSFLFCALFCRRDGGGAEGTWGGH